MGLKEEELGYLYGFYCGDGYAYHDKKSRHRYVEFFSDSKDNEIISLLQKFLAKSGFKPFLHKDSRFNCIRIRVNSKRFFEKIQTLEANLPTSAEFSKGFLEGLIDADGYTNRNKGFIELVNTDEDLLRIAITSLGKLGIKSSIKKRPVSSKDKKPSFRIYVPLEFKRFNTLSVKVRRIT